MRRPTRLTALTITAAALAVASVAEAVPWGEKACGQTRMRVETRYEECEATAVGAYYASDDFANRFAKVMGRVSKCLEKYRLSWDKLQAKSAGTGITCAQARWADNGDGTVSDNLTGLQWEQKTDDGSVHDKDDSYTWSTLENANGTVFTSFLSTLNGACFAGHCDWRLPTRSELRTIVAEAYPCSASPCINETIFGPTAAGYYWSATESLESDYTAWLTYFVDGGLNSDVKTDGRYARAVRGGL
jgi:hypothetical protein